ncbi:hypothetical protein FRC10_010362 [Ceratobasidium sp. 414]|nr:hypothetical protein FRC10_010362 [Ceratobasidium sp. 414]
MSADRLSVTRAPRRYRPYPCRTRDGLASPTIDTEPPTTEPTDVRPLRAYQTALHILYCALSLQGDPFVKIPRTMELDHDEWQCEHLVKVKMQFDELRALIHDIKYPSEAVQRVKWPNTRAPGKMRVHDLKFPERIEEQVGKCRKLVRGFAELKVVPRASQPAFSP